LDYRYFAKTQETNIKREKVNRTASFFSEPERFKKHFFGFYKKRGRHSIEAASFE
jgi:hypothetical protein